MENHDETDFAVSQNKLRAPPRHGVGKELQDRCGETSPDMTTWINSLERVDNCRPEIELHSRTLQRSATFQCSAWCVSLSLGVSQFPQPRSVADSALDARAGASGTSRPSRAPAGCTTVSASSASRTRTRRGAATGSTLAPRSRSPPTTPSFPLPPLYPFLFFPSPLASSPLDGLRSVR